MSFPNVNGTLIDTVLESRPIAMLSGFFSGSASAAILRNEDALFPDSCAFEGRRRLHIDLLDGFDSVCVGPPSVVLLSETGAEGDDERSGEREGREVAKHRREGSFRDASRLLIPGAGVWNHRRHGGLETCRERGPRAAGRRVGVTRMRAWSANIVVDVEGSAARGSSQALFSSTTLHVGGGARAAARRRVSRQSAAAPGHATVGREVASARFENMVIA
ncbi:hypothetical protein LXA43DRAFT_1066683 [Ganoderma leucocontextum]|nr:hypothetical protein LXA43DRAFT_1066683 [Ganoderma leucocontextum]